ncbi:MAG: hypothetical protein BWZ10_02896 [candidate division BRC1 bacterium ADurb.BinA364]|nr:MAG: hypothetical protein BWZ10_02896 [candidate division BRC1 bacterium ADurb.BinA364]
MKWLKSIGDHLLLYAFFFVAGGAAGVALAVLSLYQSAFDSDMSYGELKGILLGSFIAGGLIADGWVLHTLASSGSNGHD